MADNDDSQAKFVKCFVDFLKEHRAVLHSLIDMESNEPETQNFDESR